MGKSKQSPPDTPGNVRGRIAALKLMARMQARATEGEYKVGLKRRMSSLAPEFKRLRTRLAKAKTTQAKPKTNVKTVPEPESVGIPQNSDLLAQLLTL